MFCPLYTIYKGTNKLLIDYGFNMVLCTFRLPSRLYRPTLSQIVLTIRYMFQLWWLHHELLPAMPLYREKALPGPSIRLFVSIRLMRIKDAVVEILLSFTPPKQVGPDRRPHEDVY